MPHSDRSYQLPFPLLLPSQLNGSTAVPQKQRNLTSYAPQKQAHLHELLTDKMISASAVMNGNYHQRLPVGAAHYGQYNPQGKEVSHSLEHHS